VMARHMLQELLTFSQQAHDPSVWVQAKRQFVVEGQSGNILGVSLALDETAQAATVRAPRVNRDTGAAYIFTAAIGLKSLSSF